ncbi:hypothetical protein HL653_16140 [Sphingomonas sp. AP4-R1]|uniref:hypothetical protein n=1 Tax=Sphingomonas sp. AP4-R1 TaxID=2735134 RepID=UPI001493A2F9|nr:hypothetical protein [Sphingomonas sp. AP4-R1]QJU59088.1 hypothetical protein HL653_16140 [Sphingomonas sp. AP4-R1]
MSGPRALRPGGSVRRTALAVAILLALLWQGVVARAHVHLPHLAAQLSVQDTSVRIGAASEFGLSDDETACLLCRELAQTADYLAPAPIAVAGPSAFHAIVTAALLLLWPRRHLPPGWRGRAPPILSEHHQP